MKRTTDDAKVRVVTSATIREKDSRLVEVETDAIYFEK